MIARLLALFARVLPEAHHRPIAVYSQRQRAVVIIAGGRTLSIPEEEVLDLADALHAAFAIRAHHAALLASGLQ